MDFRTSLLISSCVLWLAACGPTIEPCGPSTCSGCCDAAGACQFGTEPGACGANGNACDVCAASQRCLGVCVSAPPTCMGQSDTDLCVSAGKACGTHSLIDSCGKARSVVCGTCGAAQACSTTSQCVCQPESDAELCTSSGASCGVKAVTDRCGRARTVSCGTCPSGTCGGGGTPNTCGCAPETDAALCARYVRGCGPLTAIDACGQTRTITSCGTCAGANTCQAGACTCPSETTAQFCARVGATCGTATALDLCGQQRSAPCGSCGANRTCGGGGTPNQCGCTPESDAAFCTRQGKNCGPVTAADNCGAPRTAVSCGTCAGTQTCGGAGTLNVCGCARETDAAFLLRLGKNCGTVTGLDSCGLNRTVYATSCSGYATCGGGGTPNVCGCTPQTNTELCTQGNNACGPTSTTDRCGVARTVDCGSCASGTRCATTTTNRTCQAFTCSSWQRACGAACADCPTTGVATTQCGAADTCVAATCATDFTLVNGVCQPVTCPGTARSCGGACRTCPTTNVATTTCSGPACIASTCVDGTGLSGGLCVPMACSAGSLFCSTACATCPTTGASTYACSATTCVASGCAAGYSLRGGRCVDSDWTVEVVEPTVSTISATARSAALAVDAAGGVHVAYVDYPNIVVARRTAAGWVITSTVALAPNGLTGVTALAIDGQGNAHVIYYSWHSITSYDSAYAARYVKIAPGGAMSLQYFIGDTYWYSGGTLSGDEGVGLALDAAGDAHIAFNTSASSVQRLKYARTWQGAWLAPIDATTTSVGYPTIAVDSTGTVVHLAGVSGTQFIYTKGTNSLFSAPITVTSTAGASLKDTQLLVNAAGVQLWANAGRNFWATSVAGAVLATPVVWGAQTGSAYVAGAPWAMGFVMLDQTSSGVSPTARSGPGSGPTLLETTNLPMGGSLARGAVVDGNGTFHGLALRYVSGGYELTYVRGH